MFRNLKLHQKAVLIMLIAVAVTAYVKYQWNNPKMSQVSMQYLKYFKDTGAIGIAKLIKEDARHGREFSQISLARARRAWINNDIERAVRYLLPSSANEWTIEKYSYIDDSEPLPSTAAGWLWHIVGIIVGCYFLGMIPSALHLLIYNYISPVFASKLSTDLDNHVSSKMLVVFLHGVFVYIAFY